MSEEPSPEEGARDESVADDGRQPDETEGGRLGHSGPLEEALHRGFDDVGQCRRRRLSSNYQQLPASTVSSYSRPVMLLILRFLLGFRPRCRVERHYLPCH